MTDANLMPCIELGEDSTAFSSTKCTAPTGIGRTRLMDQRGDGVPIILRESVALSGHPPEYSLINESELRLLIWAAA